MKATGENVAFFQAGAAIVALFPWDKLAADATLADAPRPHGLPRFHIGMELRLA